VPARGAGPQKFLVLRHPGRTHLDVAYVGGIDVCHGRHLPGAGAVIPVSGGER
jgi:hypothetical protein